MKLLDYEWKILADLCGVHVEGIAWGAAMGQAREVLEGRGLACRHGGAWGATEAGELRYKEYVALSNLANWAAEDGDPDVLALAQAALDEGESSAWRAALAIHAVWAPSHE